MNLVPPDESHVGVVVGATSMSDKRVLGQVPQDAVIRGRAPLRISFGGGGTDLMPYALDHGGLVLSSTISRYAYATLRIRPGTEEIRVRSLDYKTVMRYTLDEPLIYDGKLDLIKACLRRMRVSEAASRVGLDLYLETDAPPGSGLGASSALSPILFRRSGTQTAGRSESGCRLARAGPMPPSGG